MAESSLMYKIYITDSLIRLCQKPPEMPIVNTDPDVIICPYSGKRKSLFQFVDLLEKSEKRAYNIWLYHYDIETLWKDFRSIFKIVAAAGGIVLNPAGGMAVIYRRGFWDLPKGKLDRGEDYESAALREVEEETSLTNLTIRSFAGSTWHAYREDGKRVLKETRWYFMEAPEQPMEPQLSERIEQVKWEQPGVFLKEYHPQYRSLKEFLKEGLQN